MTDFDEPERPIRILVFPERPDTMLLICPEGQDLFIPRLRSPFDRYQVAMKLADAEVAARVHNSVPGRFTHALAKDAKDADAERSQQERQRQAARHVEIRFDPNATDIQKQRADLVLKKNEIDEEIRKLKKNIGVARSKAFTKGHYSPALQFRGWEAKLGELQTKSLAIQAKLGELRKAERDARSVEDREALFIEAAKKVLSRDLYLRVWDLANTMKTERSK